MREQDKPYRVSITRAGFAVIDDGNREVALRHSRYQAQLVAGMLNKEPGHLHHRSLVEWEPYGLEWGPHGATLRMAGV